MSRSETSSTLLAAVRPWFFPLGCAALYGVAWIFDPEKTMLSLRAGGRILMQLGLPLCVAVSMMVLLNRFLSPSLASRLLGRRSGLGGLLLSSVAGIVSMGPIYAWYPLFTALKDKGASAFNIANFMCCRSVQTGAHPGPVGLFRVADYGRLPAHDPDGGAAHGGVRGVVVPLWRQRGQTVAHIPKMRASPFHVPAISRPSRQVRGECWEDFPALSRIGILRWPGSGFRRCR